MTSFKLKLIALFLMVIDHLAYWGNGLFPTWFRWLGRASAPIFIFCLVCSYDKTHSKEKFLLRLYISSICMASINVLFMCLGYVAVGDDVGIIDLRGFGFFSTLFIISLIIYILQIKSTRKRIVYITGFIVWQSVCAIALTYIAYRPLPFFEWSQSGVLSLIVPILASTTGNILWTEGSLLVVLLGVLLYYAKDNKRSLVFLFTGFFMFYFLYSLTDWHLYAVEYFLNAVRMLTGSEDWVDLAQRALETAQLISFGQGVEALLFVDYRWMMIGALPVILMYNGERGSSYKNGFYFFYPAHIYLCWGIRLLLLYFTGT